MPEKVRKGSINLTKIMTWKQTCRSWFSPRCIELGGVVLFVVIGYMFFPNVNKGPVGRPV